MWAKPILPIVVSVVWGLLLAPGAFGALMSPMIFDSGESARAWTIFTLIVSFPILCVISIVASWLLWPLARSSAMPMRYVSIAVACLPLVPIVVLTTVFWSNPNLR
ncbi:MAG TPA: hypothetical protein VNG31_07365 [Candidatus Baltobacteraceae bacterium]|nr:hypothetical protein [Candidatus Baltobacteraceae bacterium]